MAWQTLPQQDYQGHPSALPLRSQRGRPAEAHNVVPGMLGRLGLGG